MKTYTTIKYTASSPGVVALGCFDGIHLGHRAVIQSAKEQALHLGLPLTVWTFEEPPKNYFFPGSVPLITDKRAKQEQMRRLGVDVLVCVPFEQNVCQMKAEDFFDTILVKRLKATHIVCGFDYSFGVGGKGTVELLTKLCHNASIGITVLPAVTVDRQAVSSSAIRQAMEAGDAEKVTALLGRPYSLRTVVVDGQKLARKLGFPTINQVFSPGALIPRYGVYATRVTMQGSKRRYYGITNVGIRPTVGGKTLYAETHIFDFHGDLYGKWVKVEFLSFIRGETSFQSLKDLQAQVYTDIAKASKIIAIYKSNC